jgi:hypothetical protein
MEEHVAARKAWNVKVLSIEKFFCIHIVAEKRSQTDDRVPKAVYGRSCRDQSQASAFQ